ncbi:hypothetical protein BIW11_05459 [Tropilaelaps mercedesae]|uniref:Uncharacterized protein n=1 Tax=Tropilaelaps mercedesae TaxID=418985 RepID=A0A1V9Y2C2_9ACAR|nr:hypothetical protein BIW11_05459 [Tropilaelaps mercedesae]
MFRGKRSRGKASRKPARYNETVAFGAVFSSWRPDVHLPQTWQPARARLPLQQIQQGAVYQHLQQVQQVSSTGVSRQIARTAVTRTNSVSSPPTPLGTPAPSNIGTTRIACPVQSPISQQSRPPSSQGNPQPSDNVAIDIQRKSLPFGWMMGRVFRCSCGASLCPSFGVHRCNCDNSTLNSLPNSNNSHLKNSQAPFHGPSYPAAAFNKSRCRGRNYQKHQQIYKGQMKQEGTQTPQARLINNVASLPKQARVITTTRNVPWPFFGGRTEQLLVSGGTTFPCVHIQPAQLAFEVHYSMVVDLVPRDPPLGYMASTPSARYLPPHNYLTGATWMAHPWKLHLETIVHAVQTPKIGIQMTEMCLADGEYTPVIRLFTTRAHTGFPGGHPSDLIEIGLRWYLTDHSFVKASLPGAEQPVLFRARRPLNPQQHILQQTPISPAPLVARTGIAEGIPAYRAATPAVSAVTVDSSAGEDHLATERRHSYLKTRWWEI